VGKPCIYTTMSNAGRDLIFERWNSLAGIDEKRTLLNEEETVKGNVASLANAIAQKLGDKNLASPLQAAMKKAAEAAKSGKEFDVADLQLNADQKAALGDAFLKIAFADPKLTTQIMDAIKKVTLVSKKG
jgi:hypothetical protein